MQRHNIEGLRDWNIPALNVRGRIPGLSAMIRLKDEAEWIIPSLESIKDWCEEIVIALQGRQADGTDTLVMNWAEQNERCFVFAYPFDSVPNGPGHDQLTRIGSVHERAYFCNWCYAMTTRTHILKWDGDMVAHDWLGENIRRRMDSGQNHIKFHGTDIVGQELRHVGEREHCASEIRVFKAAEGAHFETGRFCEKLVCTERAHVIEKSAFLHFKWSKRLDSATKAWPENWEQIPHFRDIAARGSPVREYRGDYPKIIREMMNA